jgi:hypothetical protein
MRKVHVTCFFEPLKGEGGRPDRNARVHADVQVHVKRTPSMQVKERAYHKQRGERREGGIKNLPS